MSNPKPLHRYALVDKTGKTRGTCEAHDATSAGAFFAGRRASMTIPKGWKILDRGPMEPPKPEPATPEPQPLDPAAFKVGDIVTGESWAGTGRIFTGKFLGWDEDGDGMIEDNAEPGTPQSGGKPWRVIPKSMRLVEAAPAPEPAPEFKKGTRVRYKKQRDDDGGVGKIVKINGDGTARVDWGAPYFRCTERLETLEIVPPKRPATARAIAPGPIARLDPYAEALLKEAQESLAAANRKEAEAVRILGLEGDLLEVAQHRMGDFHSLRAQLAEAVLERDAHKVSLDALNAGRDAMIQERDQLRARVKELEAPPEILGTMTIMRRGDRTDLHMHMTDKGQKMDRSAFAATVSVVSGLAADMARNLANWEHKEKDN